MSGWKCAQDSAQSAGTGLPSAAYLPRPERSWSGMNQLLEVRGGAASGGLVRGLTASIRSRNCVA